MISEDDNYEKRCLEAWCRCCQHSGLKPIINFGSMPLSNGLLTKSELTEPEDMYPLEVAFCSHCSLVQIIETVPPEKIFSRDYPYYSSFSDALLTHSRENVLALIEKGNLGADSFVVELGSNDGYLLRNYVENGIPCIGIDPAEGPAKAAEEIGVPTLCAFFTQDLAKRLVDEGRKADVIHANNVLAHVADTNGFVEGIRILLKDKGIAAIEVPYIGDLIDHCEFDTIYHEHLCYFSVTALDRLFRRHRLFLNDIRRLSIHGGSLRLYVEPQENVLDSVQSLLAEEADLGLDQYSHYENFRNKIQEIGKEIRELISKLKANRNRIVAYGAAAKGTILLNYIGAGPDVIDYVVDRNAYKQGKYIPGMHIPIYDPARLMEDMPDYVLLLVWNFKDEILSQQTAFRENGGKFIIPIPKLAIV